MSGAGIPAGAAKVAGDVFTETLVALRLKEGGGFKVASQQRRAIAAALAAAAPHLIAQALNDAADDIRNDMNIAQRVYLSRWLRARAEVAGEDE